ncbi:hypothetical protein [Streptomyces sp. Wb2n-11]|uniref:hypothetical protein n=1 Tax=Streptomyces sp. Wb2n-11 TaxID=1030533 RepID=UPI000ADC1C9F|nr:hypothetical protein [Streptomyces sp. Wb2n-11]
MANWNLSVDLRGQGTSLVRTLRQSATHARTLADATDDAQSSVRSLGRASQTAARHVRSLGRGAADAHGNVTRLGSASATAQRRLTRLAGQARNAARDMRRLARAAEDAEAQLQSAGGSIQITAGIDDQTGPGMAAVRAAVAQIQALSPVQIDVRFDADAAGAAAALAAVRSVADDTSLTLRALRARAAATADALDDLADRARNAAGGLRSLNTAARNADTSLASLSDRTRTLRTDLDDLDGSVRRAGAGMGGLRGNLGSVSSSAGAASGNTRTLMLAAIGLATALIPVAAATVPIAAGLTAAGVAVGVFGAAIGGQIKALGEASEAEQKYDEAVREHGKSSAEAAKAEAEYLRLIAEMPPATRQAAAAVTHLKDEYQEWSDSLASSTMPVAVKGMGLLEQAMEPLSPLVRGTSVEMDRFMNIAAGAMQTEGFDQFVEKFTAFAVESLARGTTGVVRFTQALDSGEIGSDLREFLDYAREHAPLVGETLGNLARVVLNVAVAGSEMGVSVLQVVNTLASLVNAIPADALAIMVQLYAAFKLAALGAGLLTAATGGAALASLAAFVRAARFGGVAAAIGGVTQRMGGLAKAAVGLGILTVAAIGISKLAEKARGAPPDVDKLTTSLKNLSLTGKFTGELKKSFGDIDGLVDQVNKLGKATKAQDEYVESFGTSGIGPLDDLRRNVHDLFSDFKDGEESTTALTDRFNALDESMAGMVGSGNAQQAGADFQLISDALRKAGKSTSEIKDLFPEYSAALEELKAEQQLAAAGMGVFGQQALDTKSKLDAQKASADGLRTAIVALNDVNRAALGGMVGFEAGIDAAAKAAKENAGALTMVNGELDLNSPKAQAAATALADLGAKTDAAATAARESGRSWEYTNGIYERGTQALITSGMQMGLTRAQATALAKTILDIPDKHSTTIEMRREDAIAGLDAVIAKIEATPNSKSVTVNALTKDAIALLNSLGYKTKTLPDGRVQVTANTGNALGGLAAVKRARDGLSDRTITITTHYRVTGSTARPSGGGSYGSELKAQGGRLRGYASGGDVQMYPDGGYIQGPGTGTSDSIFAMFGSGAMARVSNTEYVVRAAAVSKYGVGFMDAINRGTLKAPGYAQGGAVTDWRYDPQSGSLYSPSEAGAAGHKTRKVKVKGKNGKFTTKEVDYFDLGTVEKKIKSASSATRSWNKDLEKVADRVGGDVAEALAAMGKDGVALTKKMANGSTKYIEEMAAALRGLAQTAKASLTDYTRQLDKATKTDSAFAKNLATLSAQGYGDLAAQLAAQGDEAAQQLAAAAVKDQGKAAKANKAAKTANNALTSGEVEQLVAIIAAVKTSKTGLHDVADTTGLGEDEIIATAVKARGQIKSSLGSRATRFLADLSKAERGLAYANGGIREGIYSTRGGAVTFAEPSTGGEAFIPLGANKRGRATNVLKDVAGRFGLGLTDAAGSRVVIIREQGPLIGSVTIPVTHTNASAYDISRQVERQIRRAQRGGVAARG